VYDFFDPPLSLFGAFHFATCLFTQGCCPLPLWSFLSERHDKSWFVPGDSTPCVVFLFFHLFQLFLFSDSDCILSRRFAVDVLFPGIIGESPFFSVACHLHSSSHLLWFLEFFSCRIIWLRARPTLFINSCWKLFFFFSLPPPPVYLAP